jgi:hypothetical protein
MYIMDMDIAEILNQGIKGKQCYIRVPLNDEIDLSPLKNKQIEEIHFAKGAIQRLHNVPSGVIKIVINDNELKELPNTELSDLVHLEANENHLSKVDLTGMVKLVSLFLDNNQIHKVQNLPESLQTLSINHNDLEDLDFDSCTNVSCSGNPRLSKIRGRKQISDPNFVLNKDPQTQILLSGGGPKRKPRENVLYTDVKQAVNEYYALKSRYEEHKKTVIKKIMDGKGYKRERVQKARNAMFKCINCGKEGGTIFTKEDNHLRAACGNKENPCNLDIEILASLTLSDEEILETQREMDVAKQKIVEIKMNTLFGYTTEENSVKEFERNLRIIAANKKNQTDLANNLKEVSYYDMQNDTKRTSIVSKKMQDVYSELAEIRRIMREYEIDGNKRLLKDVAQKHKTIKEMLNVIQSIKYPICEMIEETVYNYVDVDGNFLDESKAPKIMLNVLKQYPYCFDDFLNPNLEKLEVQKYTMNAVQEPLDNEL